MAAVGKELQQQALGLHQRLLNGDPTASADITDLLLGTVVKSLNGKWPGLVKSDACYDAAVEVLVTYLCDPGRYVPSRSSLLGWLVMQAHADLKNDHSSKPKRFERAWLLESSLPANPETGESRSLGDEVASFDEVPDVDASVVWTVLRQAFPDSRDRQLIWLMLVEGSRSSDEAARVLGLTEVAPDGRKAAVKRHKDRIMQRLRRLGLEDYRD